LPVRTADDADVLLRVEVLLLQPQQQVVVDAAADGVGGDGLAFEIGRAADGAVLAHAPVDGEVARAFLGVLGNDVGLEAIALGALGHGNGRQGGAVERAGQHALHHRRGALQLLPVHLVLGAEVGEQLRPLHHQVLGFLVGNGPADADGGQVGGTGAADTDQGGERGKAAGRRGATGEAGEAGKQ
jgi:hypothetical protein